MSSDARERAVRVLADYDARRADNAIARAHRCAEALRALLAAEPAKGAETHRPVLSVHGMDDTCDLCQRAIPDGCYAVFCGVCEDKLRAAVDGPPPVPIDPPAPPASAEVREAAESAATDLGNVLYNIETAEVSAAWTEANEIRERLLAALRGGQKGEGR